MITHAGLCRLSELAYVRWEDDSRFREELMVALHNELDLRLWSVFNGASTDAFICYDPTTFDVVFVVRGTEVDGWADIRRDLDVRYFDGKHRGFVRAYEEVERWLETELKAVAVELGAYPPEQGKMQLVVHCTGHSLGGAVAVLAADDLFHLRESLRGDSPISWFYPVSPVTFGAPRTHKRSKALSPLTHVRYVNGPDIVPRLPLILMGFEHRDPDDLRYLGRWPNWFGRVGRFVFALPGTRALFHRISKYRKKVPETKT